MRTLSDTVRIPTARSSFYVMLIVKIVNGDFCVAPKSAVGNIQRGIVLHLGINKYDLI